MISVLSGGVGAARLLRALSGVVEPTELTGVVNVGDDLVIHGLQVCPDLDTIMYSLAGLNNEELGWGLAGETWRVMSELERLGGESWFALGDRDLATHLYRTQRLRDGATKTDVTAELCEHFGVRVRLLPITNDPVATEFDTDIGRLSFQDYFVRHAHSVAVSAVHVAGAELAHPTPEALQALEHAARLVIAPSNPLISVDPILKVAGVRDVVARRRADVVAVSPIVAGKALKGPADRLLAELGHDVSVLGVVDFYDDLVGTWIIDERDARYAAQIEDRGMNVVVTTTVMADPAHARQLAQAVVA